jgi:hypothetical protein
MSLSQLGVPKSWISESGRAPVGTYQGVIADLSWRPLEWSLAQGWEQGWNALVSRSLQVSRLKRWVYFFIDHPAVSISGALVHTGYGLSAFITAFDVHTGERLYDRSFVGIPGLQGELEIRGGLDFEGHFSLSPLGGFEMELTADRVRVEDPTAGVSFTVEWAGDRESRTLRASRAWSVVGEWGHLPQSRPVMTQKEVLIPSVRGELRFAGRLSARWDGEHEGVRGGTDLTMGFLPRETQWDWSFGFGKVATGAELGWNLSSANHLGCPEGESAVFWKGKWITIQGLRWTRMRPETGEAWVESATGNLKLHFVSSGIHEEKKNLGVLKSDFSQWTGVYSGEFLCPESQEWVRFEGFRGQWEWQSVMW